MGDIKGFLKVKRQNAGYRPVCERIKDFQPVTISRPIEQSKEQASRCMDCGTPFCHWGCPIGNYIPEWNDFLFHGFHQKAFELLDAVNNLPEITGRLCPAICEYACVLGISDDPVTVRENELAIIEYAFKKKIIKANPPKKRTEKKIAVVGSGPAGLSCAAQLNRKGHKVVVFEKDDKIGGLLRYGIPDFKLEKNIIDRRLSLWREEGIEFKTGVDVGVDYRVSKLKKEFDAVSLACGSRVSRDLKIEGRELKGIHFALDYLTQANKIAAGVKISENKKINVKDEKVLVIGGGDTGSDCIGTANRQGAKCVTQIEILEQPSLDRTSEYPWPVYPLILRKSSSHEEGAQRHWSVLTKKFTGENGNVKGVLCARVEYSGKDSNGRPIMKEIAGSEFVIEADLVVLAIGFTHPEHSALLKDLKLDFDARGNVKAGENYMTCAKGVFSCGDMHRGQSLIVWAIAEGRAAAENIDKYLSKKSKSWRAGDLA
ncbi:MAG: glutamate synthase subunit beta [Candidatus Omnitrophota bacterium]